VLGATALAFTVIVMGGRESSGDVADVGPADPDPRLLPAVPVGMTPAGPVPLAAAGERTTVMHVVAHPDDDLFFINPDIQATIAAGHRIVGVCVTSAEGNGHNGPHSRSDARGYTKARQNALRAAYLAMAPGAGGWSESTITLPNGAVADMSKLGDQVVLIFLDLRKTFWTGRLRNLWAGRIGSLPTLVPRGSMINVNHHYKRTEVIEALVHLFDVFKPTLVRTLDPDPDLQVHDYWHPRHTDYGGYSDHEDHTATAQFTWAALNRWAGPGGGRYWATESYRGYYNRRWPYNLSIPAWEAKRSLLEIYSGDTPETCADPVGCADLAMLHRISLTAWGQSTHHRYESTASWLLPGTSGALTAFTVLNGQAARWTETAPGSGRWTGPDLLGGGPLVPALAPAASSGQAVSGPTQPATGPVLLAQRIDELGPHGHDHRRTVRLWQHGAWTDLGTPEHGSRMRQLGVPVAARERGGALRVFARTSGKTPATRVQRSDGSWTPWHNLGGAAAQEGLASITLADGRIELYGAGHSSLLRWYQRTPGGPFAFDATLQLPAPGTPPAVVQAADGTVVVVYRLPGNGEVVAFTRAHGSSRFTAKPVALGGQGGVGPVRLVALPGSRLAVVQRNDAGIAALTVVRLPFSGPPPVWNRYGPWLTQVPSAALDARGRLVLAGVRADAGLWTKALDRY